jgi:hypothetical protein
LLLNVEARRRFDQEKLRELLLKTSDPPFHGFLKPTHDNILGVKPEADPKGWVSMWEQPKLGRSYVIGAEGEGVEKSAVVLDRDLSLCVEWHGHADVNLFADEVVKLAGVFNGALVATADDDCSLFQTLHRRGYQRLYRHDHHGLPKISWIAASIDGLDALIREGVNWPSRELLEQLLSVVVKDNGQVELHGKSRAAALAVAVKVKHDSSLESVYPALRARRARESA